MNVVQHYNHKEAGIVGFARETSPVYASVAHGQLTPLQINALAITCKTFFHQNYITISPNLNIKLGDIAVAYQNELSNYLMNYELFFINTDITIPYDRAYDAIDENEKIILVNIPQGKLHVKQLYGLAVLLRLENVQDIHLINDRGFLFMHDVAGRFDVLHQGIEELGFQLQAII